MVPEKFSLLPYSEAVEVVEKLENDGIEIPAITLLLLVQQSSINIVKKMNAGLGVLLATVAKDLCAKLRLWKLPEDAAFDLRKPVLALVAMPDETKIKTFTQIVFSTDLCSTWAGRRLQ